MPESAARAALLRFVRSPDEANFAALADPGVTINLDMRDGSGSELSSLLSGIDASQRAGITVLGDESRTVLIIPARTGRPETRILLAVSHPAGPATEIAAYADGVSAGAARSAAEPPPSTRAIPSASPSPAAGHQRVLVTASTDALGFAIASAFLASGASVAFHGHRDSFELPQARSGAVVAYVAADLSSAGGTDSLAEEAAVALGGPITVLVNNFGPWDGTPLSQISMSSWQYALQSGLTAHLRLAQLVAPGMREIGRGRIVNITAVSSTKANHGTYGFVKAAVAFLTEALASELAPEVTVNSVAPGQIDESVPLMNSLDPRAVPAMLGATPLGRFVTRAEVAEAIVAITRGSAFDAMTGATIPLSGGYHLASDEGA